MKRILPFILLFCPLGAFSTPWGTMGDYDLPPAPRGEERSFAGTPSETPGERYLLRQVLAGQPVRILLEPGEESKETLSKYRQKIQEAYNNWFLNTAKHIRNSKREHEFADILPALERGIPVEFVEAGEDISFEFVDRREIASWCTEWSSACYVFDGPKIYVPKNPRGQKSVKGLFGASSGKLMFANLVHEIGHSLGFSDQYVLARDRNTHRIYRGQNTDNTIMNSQNLSLTCDDADGIVNLIDITNRTFRGGKKGWRSLCKKSTAYYVGGSQLGIGPYAISSKDNNVWSVKTYQDGVLEGEKDFVPDEHSLLSPFVPFSENVIKKDILGRPLLARGPHGEEIYYMHLYDASLRLVTKDGKNMLVEERSKLAEKGKTFYQHAVWFYANGRQAFLKSSKYKSKGLVTYDEGPQGEFVSLEMRFDKEKQMAFWSGSEVENPTIPSFSTAAWASQAAARKGGIAGKVAEQVKKRYDSAQKQYLTELVEQWYKNDKN